MTVDVADPGGLPEDPNWRGFERVGSVLSISPAHIEKYLSAAEGALTTKCVATAFTVTLALPVMEPLAVSVARIVWLPGVTRLTPAAKVCVPLSPLTKG